MNLVIDSPADLDQPRPGRILEGEADPTRLPVAVVSLLLLLVGLGGWVGHNAPLRAVGFVLFAILGIGGAWVTVLNKTQWPALALGPPMGLAIVTLVSFALVELRWWAAAPWVFGVMVALAAAVHVATVRGVFGRWHHRSHDTTPDGGAEPMRLGQAVLGSVRRVETPRWVSYALALVGLALCLASAAALAPLDPGPGGLLAVVSPAWYLGLAMIVAAVLVGLFVRGAEPGVSVVALVVAFAATPAVAYSLPRYSWTAKHVGVTSYMLAHGSVSAGSDIYQAWPGVFSAMAWFSRVSATDPMSLARWWPLAVDVVMVLTFVQLAFRVLGDRRHAWLAAVVLVVGSTIGQDYFSPQSAAFVLGIAVFAVAFRPHEQPRGLAASEWIAVLVLTTAVAVTHQLTPYMIMAPLVILAVFGLARSPILPVAAAAPAVVWTLLHLSAIRQYFSLGQLGDVTGNVLTRGLSTPGLHRSTLIIANSLTLAGDAIVIGVIALLALYRNRTRTNFALALCAASGAGLLLANSYGNEGSFRVLLFALPWLAILAASWDLGYLSDRKWVWIATLSILSGAFVFVNMGLDYINVERPGDVQAVATFETTAPKGSVLFVFGNGYTPLRVTSRYDQVIERFYPAVTTLTNNKQHFNPGVSYQEFLLHFIPRSSLALRRHHFFVLTARQPETNMVEYSLLTEREYRSVDEQILHSRNWRLVRQTATSSLYELQSVTINVKPPTIAGKTHAGQLLTAVRGGWTSLSRLKFTYLWHRCDAQGAKCQVIDGATHPTFYLRSADVGHVITVVVTATDHTGRTTTVTAKPVGPIGNPPPPQSLAAPLVTGTPQDGQQLKATTGKWSSTDKIALAYQWQICDAKGAGCANIKGATSPVFNLHSTHVGNTVVVRVSATDLEGQSTTVASAPAGPVANPSPPGDTVLPAISGSPGVGQKLAVNTGKWSSPDSFTLSYQWERCDGNGVNCVAIPNAVSPVYTLTLGDVGHQMSAAVTATDLEGQKSIVNTAPVGPVGL